MFLTFNTKSLKITKPEIQKYHMDGNKKEFAISVFKMSLEQVINDIIENGVEFQFQNSGKDKAYMRMQRISGQEYVKLRKRGAFKNFDPVETNFNAYRVEYVIEKANGKTLSIPIHLDRTHSKRIEELASAHKLKVGPVKTYQDYYKYIYEAFPTLDKNDVFRIFRFGYNSFRSHLANGADILIHNRKFVLQTGKIYTNWKLMIEYVLKKMRIKSRILYRRLHYLWDGYSYFSLTSEKFEAIKKDYYAGKKVDFGKVALLKCYDEAIASSFDRVALFKVKAGDENTRFMNLEHLVTDKAELIEIFHEWTWDTIRLTNRTYMTLFPSKVSIQQIYDNNYQPYIQWLRARRWKLLRK